MTKPADRSAPQQTPPTAIRLLSALVIVAVALAYTAGVVAGYVPEERRIDAANLAVIALAALCIFVLLKPRAFDRLKMFEAGGFRLELLERVRERQAAQESE